MDGIPHIKRRPQAKFWINRFFDAYFRLGKVKFITCRIRKKVRIGPHRVRAIPSGLPPQKKWPEIGK